MWLRYFKEKLPYSFKIFFLCLLLIGGFVYHSVYQSVWMSVFLFVYLFIFLFVRPSVRLFLCFSVCPSACTLFVYPSRTSSY